MVDSKLGLVFDMRWTRYLVFLRSFWKTENTRKVCRVFAVLDIFEYLLTRKYQKMALIHVSFWDLLYKKWIFTWYPTSARTMRPKMTRNMMTMKKLSFCRSCVILPTNLPFVSLSLRRRGRILEAMSSKNGELSPPAAASDWICFSIMSVRLWSLRFRGYLIRVCAKKVFFKNYIPLPRT